MTMNKYYYIKQDTQHGPLPLDELKGQITRDTLVWCEGMPTWIAAKDIPEVAAILPPPIPVTPPPPPTYDKPVENTKTNKGSVVRKVLLGICILIILVFGVQIAQSLAYQPTDDTEKLEIIANWQSYFKAELVDATLHDFGGMSEVFINVSNKTTYIVDQMTCKLVYWKENGDVYKVETMNIPELEPYETRKVQAPGSHRGTKVTVDVVAVQSHEIGMNEKAQ